MRRLGAYFLTTIAMVLGVVFVSPAQTQPLLTRHVREVTRTRRSPARGAGAAIERRYSLFIRFFAG